MDKSALKGLKGRLPLNPGLNGKEEYFNSAVLVLLMLIKGEYYFVFEKRATGIRQAGEICFPGGKFDPDQDGNFREAAIRETVEELGVKRETIDILGSLDMVLGNLGVTVDAFLGVINVDGLNDLKVNKDEVEKVFVIPVSYFENTPPETYKVNMVLQSSYINESGEEVLFFPAKELGLPERYTGSWGNIMRNIYVYRVDEVTIWGITARLIKDVIGKIKSLS